MSTQVVAAVILLIGTLSGSIVTGLFLRKKIDAEGTHILTQAAVSLVAPLRVQVRELEKRMDAWENRAKHWEAVARAGAAMYRDQYGVLPDWWKEFKEEK